MTIRKSSNKCFIRLSLSKEFSPTQHNPTCYRPTKKSGLYTRDPKQSTDFSFTRFLVPYLQNYEGWAMFMDCDMLCREDINNLGIKEVTYMH